MPVQGIERHLVERVRSREVTEGHFVVELSNDPDVILTSMKSYDPLLTSVVMEADSGALRLVRCGTRDEQRAFYAASRAEQHMIRVDLFTSFASDWYGFVHGVATSEALGSRKQFTAELVGLLPTTPDEDTVAGEIGLAWPLVFAKRGDAPGEVGAERVASKRAHDVWLDAFRLGDAEKIGALYGPEARCAFRHPFTGQIASLESRDAITDYYRALLHGTTVRSLDIVTRLTDRWFVFTELVLRLDHADRGAAVARLADICVLDRNDTVLVHLGTSPEPAAWS